jgi:plasmid stabilization system protein ParE
VSLPTFSAFECHFPYTIYFRVRAEHVIVIAVFHVRRNPMIWRERA